RWNNLPKKLQKLSLIIFQKIKNSLPEVINYKDSQYVIDTVSRDLTFIKYEIGGIFDIHKDFVTGGALNKNFFTVNIYLNDLHQNDGGQLNLYDDQCNLYKTICPQGGKAVIFDMNT